MMEDSAGSDLRDYRFAVSGASGFIGRHLVQELLDNRDGEIFVLVRSSSKPRLEALTDAEIHAAAREVYHPESMTWVIVGDLSKIEAPLRELGLGSVQVLEGLVAGDRIVILEDTDGDGTADSSKVFTQDPSLFSPLGITVLGNSGSGPSTHRMGRRTPTVCAMR